MSMLDLTNHFTLTKLTASINELPYKPGRIGELGLFQEDGITTTTAVIEQYEGVLSLVEVAPRGAPAANVNDSKRKIVSMAVPHIPQRATILAAEVQNVRAFGTENQLEGLEQVISRRLSIMKRNLEYTIESHRLSAIMGKYYDAAGNQVSLYSTFGVSQKTVNFALATDTTEVTGKIQQVLDEIENALGGLAYDGITVICSPQFYDALIVHPKVKEAYLNYSAAAQLRGEAILTEFVFNGVRFIRYRGTTDVKVPDGQAYAFPTGVAELFITRYAPADYVETVNTVGLPYYAKMEPMDFNKGYQLEAQSNPLNICTRPRAVIKLTA
ncbi:major capsid protein [Sulfurivirga sp.]|uniref:major capsid protein n=1 Tax=Sulfurivirga sp. TaxID=2614236 RepID=UPI0025FBB3A8|nr:major capsid protein [Sulfurivirga sp.]